MLSEVSDDSNQALGISMAGAAFGTGYILGPAVAGAIADPIEQYNLTITSKHKKYSLLLPLEACNKEERKPHHYVY
jgi:MFS family permease